MPVEYREYNGHPTILLKSEEGFPTTLCFGLRKAQLIMEHINEIKKFIEEKGIKSVDKKYKPTN